VASTALVEAGVACESFRVTTSADGLAPGGTITVTVACSVDLTDALLPGLSTTWLSTTAVEPIDAWRSGADR
jgi:hypothetical protein